MSQSYPHIVSRVNGMKIPLLPGQAGIMHRFEHPENRLVIASTSHNPITDARDDATALVVPSTQGPEDVASAAPHAPAPAQAAPAPVSDELAAMRAQMAEQAAQLAAAQAALAAATAAAAKPAKAAKAKAAAPAPVEGNLL